MSDEHIPAGQGESGNSDDAAGQAPLSREDVQAMLDEARKGWDEEAKKHRENHRQEVARKDRENAALQQKLEEASSGNASEDDKLRRQLEGQSQKTKELEGELARMRAERIKDRVNADVHSGVSQLEGINPKWVQIILDSTLPYATQNELGETVIDKGGVVQSLADYLKTIADNDLFRPPSQHPGGGRSAAANGATAPKKNMVSIPRNNGGVYSEEQRKAMREGRAVFTD